MEVRQGLSTIDLLHISVLSRILVRKTRVLQWSSIYIIFYLPRLLMLSSTMRRDCREVKRIRKGVVVEKGGR